MVGIKGHDLLSMINATYKKNSIILYQNLVCQNLVTPSNLSLIEHYHTCCKAMKLLNIVKMIHFFAHVKCFMVE
jgi:hypothetical protein